MREAVVDTYRLSLAIADTAGARADPLNVPVNYGYLTVRGKIEREPSEQIDKSY